MTPAGTAPTAASAPLARNDYREGQVLRARDLERESGYFLARDRQHAALAHIPGILRGLRLEAFERGTENAVAPEDVTGEDALDLFLQAGVAVDGYGRMISVPRREQLRVELAAAPALLREGRYRVELLYDRTPAGGGAGAAGASGGPCAGTGSAAEGGSRTVRERYRLRLVDARRPLAAAEPGRVLDGPPDAPEHEAPVVLGTLDWNGTDAFVGFTLLGRVYAGVRAEVVASPDERTELDLRDPRGNVAVRFAPEAAPGQAPQFTDAVRIGDGGAVWVRDDVSVGPDGVRFRPAAETQVETNWTMGLHDGGTGSSFGKKPGPTPGEEVDVGPPPEYVAGEKEMRVVFERAETAVGRRRVVIGHVARDGGAQSFQPSVIVYDRPPTAAEEGSSTVEVWGDLFIRGTAYLTGVQRVSRGSSPQAGGTDELDLLLRQMAGPLAGAFRAFLLSDPDWLDSLGDVLADRVPQDPEFVAGVAEALQEMESFIAVVAAEASDDVATALVNDETMLNTLVVRLRNNAAFLAGLSTELGNNATFLANVSGQVRANPQFVADLTAQLRDTAPFIAAVGEALRGNASFVAGISAALRDDAAFVTALGDRLRASAPFVNALATSLGSNATLSTAVADRLRNDASLAAGVSAQIAAAPATVTGAVVQHLGTAGAAAPRNQLAATLTSPILDQATPGSALSGRLAGIVVEEVDPGGDGTPAARLTAAMIEQIRTVPGLRAALREALATQP